MKKKITKNIAEKVSIIAAICVFAGVNYISGDILMCQDVDGGFGDDGICTNDTSGSGIFKEPTIEENVKD